MSRNHSISLSIELFMSDHCRKWNLSVMYWWWYAVVAVVVVVGFAVFVILVDWICIINSNPVHALHIQTQIWRLQTQKIDIWSILSAMREERFRMDSFLSTIFKKEIANDGNRHPIRFNVRHKWTSAPYQQQHQHQKSNRKITNTNTSMYAFYAICELWMY